MTNGGQRGRVLVRNYEIGLHLDRPIDKEPHRLIVRKAICRLRAFGVWQRKGWNAVRGFADDVEALLAGCKDKGLRAVAKEGIGERRASPENVLTVIEHQKHMLAPQALHQALRQGLALLILHF